jgi:hypothetical protein
LNEFIPDATGMFSDRVPGGEMATMQHLRRPRTMDLVLVAAVAVVAGLLLIWSATPKSHVVDAPATPGNEMLDDHAWSEQGCVLPGAGIDSVPGLFDFRHACTHHDGCYQGLNRAGEQAVTDRLRCDDLFRTDLTASCEDLHGAVHNWRARECVDTANAYYEVARSFGRTYYTGSGDAS